MALSILGRFLTFSGGKLKNKNLTSLKQYSFRRETVYIVGHPGEVWRGPAPPPPKKARWRDRGIMKMGRRRFSGNIEDIYKKLVLGKSWGGVCLVGEMFLHPVGVFLSYLEAPSSHIGTNISSYIFVYTALAADMLPRLHVETDFPWLRETSQNPPLTPINTYWALVTATV